MNYNKCAVGLLVLLAPLALDAKAESIPFAIYSSLLLQEGSTSSAVLAGVYAEGPWSWSPEATAQPLPGWGPGSTVLVELAFGQPSLNPQTLVLTVPTTGKLTFASRAPDGSANGSLVLENAGAQRIDLNASNAIVMDDVGYLVTRTGGPLLEGDPTFTITNQVEATGAFQNIRVLEGAQEFGAGVQIIPRIPGLDIQTNLLSVLPVTMATQAFGAGMYELVPEPSSVELAALVLIVLCLAMRAATTSVAVRGGAYRTNSTLAPADALRGLSKC